MNGKYRKPRDPVTQRIVASFDDFVGWVDEPAVLDTPRSGSGPAAPTGTLTTGRPDCDTPRENGGVQQRTPDDALVNIPYRGVEGGGSDIEGIAAVCPSCGVSLPDPRHLVSNAILGRTT